MQAGGSSLQSANIEAQFPRGASAPRIDPSTMNESEELSEGALLEMQFMAWKKTAEENALETPDPEEVLAAAVLNDPIAVIMSGFGWTEDPKLAATLATRYRECLAELLNGRLHSRSFAAASKTVAAKAVSEPVNSDSGPTDEEILSSQIEAWKETAVVFDFEAPSPDRIQLMMNMGPQDSVRQLLLMEYDVEEPILEEITECYSEALKKSSEKYLQRYKVSPKIQPQTSSFASAQKSKDVSGDEIYQAAFDAWTSTAWKLGFPLPDQEQVQFAMSVGPQQAILFGFHWTDSEEEAEKIAQQYLDQIRTKRDSWIKQGYTTTVKIETNTMETESLPLVCVKHGVSEWIKSLRKVDMGCGVVSYLEEDQMAVLLEYAGLSDLLPSDVRVSHSNGYQRDSQQLLGAALRIERRPDHCVVFDTSPYASVAAREMDMRSVSLVGPYPRYELQAADTSAVSVDELTAMNIRRLFGERVYDQPMLDMQNSQPETNKRVKTKYDWADD
jgi:beta-phosphoglucomutase-like phosphatase (HAD superfamily)